MADALSTALQMRRGKGIDPSMVSMASAPSDASAQISQNKPQDVRKGFESGASVGSSGGTVGVGQKDASHSGIDSRLGVGGGQPPGPEHMEQHTSPINEASGSPQPAAQSAGVGGGDLNSQIRGYVTGHASQSEYDQLKGMSNKPRSLGERAKMDALKTQYAGKGNTG